MLLNRTVADLKSAMVLRNGTVGSVTPMKLRSPVRMSVAMSVCGMRLRAADYSDWRFCFMGKGRMLGWKGRGDGRVRVQTFHPWRFTAAGACVSSQTADPQQRLKAGGLARPLARLEGLAHW